MCREPRARRSPEHGHRLPATLVGCLTLILALSIVVRESRPSVRALGLLALLAIVLQGILGGVTVLYKLPLAVSVAHACLGQTFFCLTVALALLTGAQWHAPAPAASSALPAVAATTTHLVVGAALLATSLTLTLRASRLIGWRGLARAPAGLGRHALL